MARADPKYSLSTGALAYPVLTGLTRLAAGVLVQRKAARVWQWRPPQPAYPAAERRSS
jgi:hypothetical protein